MMSQRQLLAELAKVRWHGNAKEYTDQFAPVGVHGVGVAPDELAPYYCPKLPTGLHLLITNNGQAYEKGPVEPSEMLTRQLGPVGIGFKKQPWKNSGYCYECQGRGHPARVCPSKGERTKRPGEACKKCGGVGHYARDCPTHGRGRTEPENKSSRQPIRPSTEKTERLNREA
ncbi:hypothetical protein, conserved [Eimeria tenella]|uniref:CCHC-type domain-containing protein n=1 Tax=Eimeria tenella TaxID=5802 RepID=U6KK27_EIMTE|nr:hypothetical protein, conserved [Eimeria tenella]CDJ38289.1 hypothetical protein, conserved [Eimeria tenella]|eukprot:XP_013229127.1 hypothetical protein, conserved [Eimeria tenella]